MKSINNFLLVVALVLLTSFSSNTFAQDEIASVEVGEAVTMQYMVCGVFKSDRSLWVFVPGDPENVESFQVSEEAHNFDQIAIGDLITVTYFGSVVLSLNEPGETPEEKDAKVLVRAAKGETPGGISVEVHEISAIVQTYDPVTGAVTLMGPKGNTFRTLVSDLVWAAEIVKVGAVVHVRYTETLAISVEKDQGYYKAPKD
jgi:hypothetical protein